MATEKQAQYIKILIDKKLDLWQVDSVAAETLAWRALLRETRETAYATHPGDVKAARAMKSDLKAALFANRQAREADYILERRDFYNSIEIPDSIAAASALIDSLK